MTSKRTSDGIFFLIFDSPVQSVGNTSQYVQLGKENNRFSKLVKKGFNTAVRGSRAGGSRANFFILRKIMSGALGPVWIFEKKTLLLSHFYSTSEYGKSQ